MLSDNCKPKIKKRTIEYWDWNECTKWVEHKLGYPIRDTLESFKLKWPNDIEYRDFWHLVVEYCDVNNPGEIYLDVLEGAKLKDWQKEILQCYLDEFGEGPYWVEW